MPEYLYKGKRISDNKVVKGEGEFVNEKEVKEYLLNTAIIPSKIVKKTAFNADLSDVGIFKPRVKSADISFFCKQFSVMLEAGISVGSALELAGKQCVNKTLKRHLQNINAEVKSGKTLSEAMIEENAFPDILNSMTESGETSGTLDIIYNKLAIYFENQVGIERKIKKALMYPILIVCVIIFAMAIIMIKVVPAFVDMFEATGVQLPWATRLLIATSDFFVKHGLIVLIVIGGIIFGIKYFKKTPTGKAFFDKMMLKLPIIAKLQKKMLTALFCETLALLNTSGVPILRSMEIVDRVLNNKVASVEIQHAMESLRHGHTLNRALSTSKIYPELLFAMLNIGEETGALDKMLVKTGDYFNEEVQLAVDQTMTLIEPLLTILIAVVVGVMMIAILLPTFTLATELM